MAGGRTRGSHRDHYPTTSLESDGPSFSPTLDVVDWTDNGHVARAQGCSRQCFTAVIPPTSLTFGRCWARDGYRLEDSGRIIATGSGPVRSGSLAHLTDSSAIYAALDPSRYTNTETVNVTRPGFCLQGRVQMARSRDFTLYLLKEGFDSSNSLREENSLVESVSASSLPADSALFVLDSQPRPPWWRDYFGISMNLTQATKGALVFLTVEQRVFALSFGHVAHNLLDECYEYDFGLRATLNCVDPLKLKNTDVVEPGAARRRRTQLSVDSDLTYFDFDRDSTVLRSLTGKVKDKYADLIKQVTGASNLRISTAVRSNDLPGLCKKLLEIYQSDEYLTTFSDIQNIVPVREPSLIEQLTRVLEEELCARVPGIHLAVPEILDYHRNFSISFAGQGHSLLYGDVSIDAYFGYLESRAFDIASLTVGDLKRHSLQLTNDRGETKRSYSVFKSLIFDTTLPEGEGVSYHLSEGQWYQVDQNYLRKLEKYLDDRWADLSLPECSQHLENEYSNAVASVDGYICLDSTNITPSGQTNVEPCDVYSVREDRALLIHIKISTDAPALSHLFNQGTNSVEKLINLVRERGNAESDGVEHLIEPVRDGRFEVMYAIITPKDQTRKSANLPLFSRVSLRRNLRALQLMNVRASFGFIQDSYHRSSGREKRRRTRKKAASGSES